MAEQIIKYGESMFKDIKPKEVLAGVKDAAVSWWNEFSPGTVAKGDVEAFIRVVGRIKNEDLRKRLQENKTLVRVAGYVQGSVALAVDGAIATVPWYLKFKNRYAGEDEYRNKQDNIKNRNAVVEKRAYEHVHSSEGKAENKMYANKRAFGLFNKDFWRDFWTGSNGYKQRQKDIQSGVEYWASEKTEAELIRTEANGDRFLNAEGMKLYNSFIDKRVSGRRRLINIKMGGLAGVEAGVFAFRPATRLAKLQTRAGEAVGSWVVDHIVNNIVKGPNPDVAPAAPKPVS